MATKAFIQLWKQMNVLWGRKAVFLKMAASQNLIEIIIILHIRNCEAVTNHSYWRGSFGN